jgi:uncharacterized membrane protein YccF (DUF307 family)
VERLGHLKETAEMTILGNIIWIICGGFLISLYYAIMGLVFCISIIGIPFGVQLFKMAGFALCPFGNNVTCDTRDMGCLSIIMNIIWIVCGGIEICLLHVGFGAFLCITIVGIPFGIQHFKMALLALAPFGQRIS